MKRVSLEQLQIASPCTESWDAMHGDPQRRHCDKCVKHVYDLSMMTRKEAQRLLSAGRPVCVRMRHDESGRVITRARWPRLRAALQWRSTRWASSLLVLALGLFWGACERTTTAMGTPLPQTQPGANTRTMGKVAPPPATQPKETMGDVAAPTTQPDGATMGVVPPPPPPPPPTSQPGKMGEVSTRGN